MTGPNVVVQLDTSTESHGEEGAPFNGTDIVATVTSYSVNPLVLPPLVYGAVLAHIGAPRVDVVIGAALGLVFFGLIPLTHVGWMRARGRIESLEIRDRSKRTEPFVVVLAAGALAFGVAQGLELTGGRLLLAMIACHVLNTSLLFLITVWWKISVHCASVAGAVGTLLFARHHLSGELLSTRLAGGLIVAVGAALVVLMVWARVRSRAHTVHQAVAGTALGLVAPYAELAALEYWIGF